MKAMIESNIDTKDWYLHLHAHLSELHTFLARQMIPHSYDAPGCEQVSDVMQIVEQLTENLPKPI